MLLMVSSGIHLASVKLRVCKGNLEATCASEMENKTIIYCRNPFFETCSFVGMFCSLRRDSQLHVLGLGRQLCLFEVFVLKLFVTFGQSFCVLTLEMHLVSTMHSVSAIRKILDLIMQ